MPEKHKTKEVEAKIDDVCDFKSVLEKLSKTDHHMDTFLILHFMAYLHSNNIPTKLFLPVAEDERKIKASIKFLKENYLISTNDDESMSNISVSIQENFRAMAFESNAEEQFLKPLVKLIIKYAIDHVSKLWKDDFDIEHGITVWKHLSKHNNIVVPDTAMLTYHVLGKLKVTKKYEEGILYGKQALDVLKKTIGKEHLTTLQLQKLLGIIMTEACKHKDAINVLNPLLKEKNPGWKDEDRMVAMVLIANNLNQICRYEEALSVYKQIFLKRSIIEKSDLYSSTSNKYAKLLHNCGKHEEAIKIIKDILKKKSEILSPDHEEILELKNNLGCNLIRLDKNNEAMEYFQEVYDKRRVILGEEHLDTLRVKHYISVVYCNQDKFNEALKIYEPLIEKFKRILGIKHPDTLCTLANYAAALQFTGQKEKALKIYKEANELQVEVLGPYDDETLRVKTNIASLLSEIKKYNESYEVYAEAYNGFKNNFGSEHPKTIEIENHMFKLKVLRTNLDTIHDIAKKGDLEAMQNLVANGADVNRKDFNENTPLHFASELGHVSVLKFLLENGAYYNIPNKDKKTPFDLAKNYSTSKNVLRKIAELFTHVKEGNYTEVERLIKNKVILNSKELSGSTALHWAVNKYFTDIITLLLENNADPTLKSNKGNTPLHIATAQGFDDIVEDLLNHVNNSDVHKNKMNDFVNAATLTLRTTCLHVASKKGFLNILKLLLKNGAFYNVKDKEGNTALELAKDYKNLDVLNFLELVVKLFDYVKVGNLEIVNEVKNLKKDEFSVLKNVRNKHNKTLLQIATEYKQNINKIISELMELSLESS